MKKGKIVVSINIEILETIEIPIKEKIIGIISKFLIFAENELKEKELIHFLEQKEDLEQNIVLNIPIDESIEKLKRLILRYKAQQEDGLLSKKGVGRLSGLEDALHIFNNGAIISD
jgi:hypothetical protein